MHFINVNVTANFGPNVCEVEWDFTLHDFYKNMVLHRDLGFFLFLNLYFYGRLPSGRGAHPLCPSLLPDSVASAFHEVLMHPIYKEWNLEFIVFLKVIIPHLFERVVDLSLA